MIAVSCPGLGYGYEEASRCVKERKQVVMERGECVIIQNWRSRLVHGRVMLEASKVSRWYGQQCRFLGREIEICTYTIHIGFVNIANGTKRLQNQI